MEYRYTQKAIVTLTMLLTLTHLTPFLVQNAMAREVSGTIIKGLIQQIDDGFTSLDMEISVIAQELHTAEENLKALGEEYKGEKDPLRRKAISADIIAVSAQLNKLSTQQIESYIKALEKFVPTFDQLAHEIRTHQGDSGDKAALLAFRNRFLDSIHNTANVISRLEKFGHVEGIDRAQLGAIKQTISTIYQANRTYSDSAGYMNADEIEATKNTYELIAAQMFSIKKLLGLEKTYLKTVTIKTLLEILGLKSSMLAEKSAGLKNVARDIRDSAFHRGQILKLATSNADSSASSSFTQQDDDPVFEDILNNKHRF